MMQPRFFGHVETIELDARFEVALRDRIGQFPVHVDLDVALLATVSRGGGELEIRAA